MKIAVIGAGFTGLAAAFYLSQKGHTVTLFEKDHFAGGLASGIRNVVNDYPQNWSWDVERFYHHWFSDQKNVLGLAKDLGIEDKLFIESTPTAILFNNQTYLYDSPLNLLKFPHLSLINKLRGALVLAFLRIFPFWQVLEKTTAGWWLRKWMGQPAFQTPWEPLLKGKFAQNYQDVNLAWFWSRIKERTKGLMYIEGGFQTLITVTMNRIMVTGGEIKLNSQIKRIEQEENRKWRIETEDSLDTFDKVIVTTSPSILPKIVHNLPADYQNLLNQKLKVIGAQVLLLVLPKPLMKDIYWLNINDLSYPFLAVVEHTNFVDPKYFANSRLVYVGEYLPVNHPHMQLSKEELFHLYLPYLEKIHQIFYKNEPLPNVEKYWHFREPFAQPVFPINHSQDIPPLETPLPNLYLASMSQVYPWDRGTEHAIELGKKAAELLIA